MVVLLLVVLVVCVVAGGFGLAVHALIWLFWLALAVFVVALVYGLVTRAFTGSRKGGPPA